MKLHHLRNLVAVADATSIRGAARAQGLAQPAITRGLRDLEKELGVPLLERHGKGVSLTLYGQSFVVRARAMLHDMERGRQEIEQLKGKGTGKVSAGLSSAVFLSLVPGVYKAFRKSYPDALLSLTEGLFPALEPQLKKTVAWTFTLAHARWASWTRATSCNCCFATRGWWCAGKATRWPKRTACAS